MRKADAGLLAEGAPGDSDFRISGKLLPALAQAVGRPTAG
jgi:hypothetical protein